MEIARSKTSKSKQSLKNNQKQRKLSRLAKEIEINRQRKLQINHLELKLVNYKKKKNIMNKIKSLEGKIILKEAIKNNIEPTILTKMT